MADAKKKLRWFTTKRQRVLIIVAIPLAVAAIVVNVILFVFRN
ncbi:MAG: hypothetical protein ACUZ8A_05605 [Candidatus Bathyanammoxibius sp.]